MPSKIRKRGINSYELTVSAGLDEHGKQRLYRKTVQAQNQTEAENLYTLFAADVLQGKALVSGTERMSLDAFYDYWKHHYANEHHAVTTRTINDEIFERISAGLGHLKIDKITPRQILQFIDQLKQPDASVDNTPLSAAYIRKHASLLKTLLGAACTWDFILSNPCDKIKLPKAGRSSKKVLSEDELKQFFAALSGHKEMKHRLWVMLAFSIGLRREEIFGLQWRDLNSEKRAITIARAAIYVPGSGIIEKDTKTDNSYRTLSLPPDIVILLDEWREEVKAASKRRAKRNKIVILDDPVAPEKWIFPQVDGSVGHPHAFNNFLKRFCSTHNLPTVGPHIFRHLSGSYLLKSGVDIATVSGKLGHADKSFTLKTYIHEIQSAEQHSAVVMQGILDNLKIPIQTKKGQAT